MSGHLMRRVTKLEAELKEYRRVCELLKDDLLMRGDKGDDGITTVNLSHGVWLSLCNILERKS